MACKEATEAQALTNPDDCCQKVPWCQKKSSHCGQCSPHTHDYDGGTGEGGGGGDGGGGLGDGGAGEGGAGGDGGGEGVTVGSLTLFEAFILAQVVKRTQLAGKGLTAIHQRLAQSEAERGKAMASYRAPSANVNRPLRISAVLPPAVDASSSEMEQEMLQMQAADSPTSRRDLEARAREREASRQRRCELVIGTPQAHFAGATIGDLTVTEDQARDVISKANINIGFGSHVCAWNRRSYLDTVATTACSKDAAASAERHALPRERYAFVLKSEVAGTIRLAIETEARTGARRRPWHGLAQHPSDQLEVPEEVVLQSCEVKHILDAAGHGGLYPQICKISEDAGTPRTYEAALESHRTPGKNLYHLVTATLGVDVPEKAPAPSATKPAPGLPLSGAATQPLYMYSKLHASIAQTT